MPIIPINIDTLPAFIETHRKLDQALKRYLDNGRSNSQTLNREQLAELSSRSANFLYANNVAGRVEVARAAPRIARQIRNNIRGETKAHFVTIAPRQFVMNLADAQTFDIRKLKNFVRQQLRGFDYLGIVEAAFYGNAPLYPGAGTRAVSWHCHAILWSADPDGVRRWKESMNARFKAIIEGPTCAHARPLSARSILQKMLYLLKGQIWEYRIIVKAKDPFSVVSMTSLVRQRHRPIRLGDEVRMRRVLTGRLIDKMLFAGGEGREILRDFRRVIRQPWERFKRDRNAKAGPLDQWT